MANPFLDYSSSPPSSAHSNSVSGSLYHTAVNNTLKHDYDRLKVLLKDYEEEIRLLKEEKQNYLELNNSLMNKNKILELETAKNKKEIANLKKNINIETIASQGINKKLLLYEENTNNLTDLVNSNNANNNLLISENKELQKKLLVERGYRLKLLHEKEFKNKELEEMNHVHKQLESDFIELNKKYLDILQRIETMSENKKKLEIIVKEQSKEIFALNNNVINSSLYSSTLMKDYYAEKNSNEKSNITIDFMQSEISWLRKKLNGVQSLNDFSASSSSSPFTSTSAPSSSNASRSTVNFLPKDRNVDLSVNSIEDFVYNSTTEAPPFLPDKLNASASFTAPVSSSNLNPNEPFKFNESYSNLNNSLSYKQMNRRQVNQHINSITANRYNESNLKEKRLGMTRSESISNTMNHKDWLGNTIKTYINNSKTKNEKLLPPLEK